MKEIKKPKKSLKMIRLLIFASFLMSFLLFSKSAQAVLFWTDPLSDKIYTAEDNGSNVQEIIVAVDSSGIAADAANEEIYYTSNGGTIQKANFDGSNVQNLVTSGLSTPRGIDLDVTGNTMYWVDTDKVMSASLDGSNVQTLFSGLGFMEDIAINTSQGTWYATEILNPGGSGRVIQGNLDGTGSVQNIVDTTSLASQSLSALGTPWGDLDLELNKLWFTDMSNRTIYRSDLDGSNVEELVTGLVNNPYGFAVTGSGIFVEGGLVSQLTGVDNDGNTSTVVSGGGLGLFGGDIAYAGAYQQTTAVPELPLGATSAVLALLGFGALAIRKKISK